MTMKAVHYRRYGGPEVLEVVDAPRPEAGAGEVLVRVIASSVNAADYRMMRADPFLIRAMAGLRRPKKPQLGVDVAGVVEAVGSGVDTLTVGDRVVGDAFGDGMGSFAEFVVMSSSSLTRMPEGLSFDDASTLPVAGVTALQALRDRGALKEGETLLVHGAGGGVGAFMIQIARGLGATVDAVCGPRSAELVSSFGARRVLDRTKTDFLNEPERYDLICGVNGSRPLADYLRVLRPGGRYVMVGGGFRQLFEAMLTGGIRSRLAKRRVETLQIDDATRVADLAWLAEEMAAGRLRAPIAETHLLEEIATALGRAERHEVRGKIVVRMVDSNAFG